MEQEFVYVVVCNTGKWEDYYKWNVAVYFSADQAQACVDHLHKAYDEKNYEEIRRFDPEYAEDGYINWSYERIPLKIFGVK